MGAIRDVVRAGGQLAVLGSLAATAGLAVGMGLAAKGLEVAKSTAENPGAPQIFKRVCSPINTAAQTARRAAIHADKALYARLYPQHHAAAGRVSLAQPDRDYGIAIRQAMPDPDKVVTEWCAGDRRQALEDMRYIAAFGTDAQIKALLNELKTIEFQPELSGVIRDMEEKLS